MGTDGEGSGHGTRRAAGPAEALDGVLEELQGILDSRETPLGPRPRREGGERPRHGPEEQTEENDELPVLSEIVIPGPAPAPAPQAPTRSEPLSGHDDLVQRLVSEVEVIVRDCVDQSLARARRDIRVRIRQHLDILMPEILAELLTRTGARES
jgi:hypothetical protein